MERIKTRPAQPSPIRTACLPTYPRHAEVGVSNKLLSHGVRNSGPDQIRSNILARQVVNQEIFVDVIEWNPFVVYPVKIDSKEEKLSGI